MFTPQVNTLSMTKGMGCMARKRIKKLALLFLMLDWEEKKKREEIGVVIFKINLIILCHKVSLRNCPPIKNYAPPKNKK